MYSLLGVCVCVYFNSRNDVPRVAQLYGTIAAHTRRRTSVLAVFVVFCVHTYTFAGFIRQTPPPTFSDTAIITQPPLWYHYFPAQVSLGADILVYWLGKIVRTCDPDGRQTLDFLRARRAHYPLGQALACLCAFLGWENKYLYKWSRSHDHRGGHASRK